MRYVIVIAAIAFFLIWDGLYNQGRYLDTSVRESLARRAIRHRRGLVSHPRSAWRVATSLPVDAPPCRHKRQPGIQIEEAGLIRHIVFFSARRKEDVEAVRTGLLALGNIPHSSLFEVTLNTKVDPLSDEVDVVVYAEFADDARWPPTRRTRSMRRPPARSNLLRELRYSADVVAGMGAWGSRRVLNRFAE